MKRPKLLRDAFGMTATLRRDMRNGFMAMPAGTRVKIRDASIGWHKLALEGEACPHCGIKPHINRVSIDDLELLERG